MSRTTLRRDHRKLCIGDLKDRVQLQLRTIREPQFGQTEFDLEFKSDKEAWASIKTKVGKTFFDGVSTDIALTHEIFLRYDAEITAETWIELQDDRLLDIVAVEDFEERHEYLRLLCRERGPKEFEATQA